MASLEQALQGRVAGADIQQNSGVPGGDLQMRILKGAAATTLYGSKGSNGVVIITTKRGYL